MALHDAPFESLKDWSAPASHAFAITPSDSATIQGSRSLWIGGAGSVAVQMQSGATVTFAGVSPGILPIAVSKVLATGTTATGILGLI